MHDNDMTKKREPRSNGGDDGCCHRVFGGSYDICDYGETLKLIRSTPVNLNQNPSKKCDKKTGEREGKINAPTFAYKTVHGMNPPVFLRGRTDAPKKEWRCIFVDEGLKDEWLDELNSLPVEIRSTDEGKGDLRPAFVIFRMPEKFDSLHDEMVSELATEPSFKVNHDIGRSGRPRICVAADVKKGDERWEGWWSSLPGKIRKAYESTMERSGNLFSFDGIESFEEGYVNMALDRSSGIERDRLCEMAVQDLEPIYFKKNRSMKGVLEKLGCD